MEMSGLTHLSEWTTFVNQSKYLDISFAFLLNTWQSEFFSYSRYEEKEWGGIVIQRFERNAKFAHLLFNTIVACIDVRSIIMYGVNTYVHRAYWAMAAPHFIRFGNLCKLIWIHSKFYFIFYRRRNIIDSLNEFKCQQQICSDEFRIACCNVSMCAHWHRIVLKHWRSEMNVAPSNDSQNKNEWCIRSVCHHFEQSKWQNNKVSLWTNAYLYMLVASVPATQGSVSNIHAQ